MTSREARRGGIATILAYAFWGFFPLYFSALAATPAAEVLSHRIVWGAVCGLLLVLVVRRFHALIAVLLDRRRVSLLACSTALVTGNWGCYIWAVSHGHTIDSAIGYFINPLFSVLLGAIFLRERLNLRQKIAVILAFSGVLVLAIEQGGIPWIALVLPLTWGLYGLVRKIVPVEAVVGFAVETLLAAPFALAFLVSRPHGGDFVTGGALTTTLLIIAGPVTALPLILFGYGARRLKLSTLGLMQYINPSMQAIIAALILGETFTTAHAVTFLLIWSGLAVYSLPFPRRKEPAPPPPVESAPSPRHIARDESVLSDSP